MWKPSRLILVFQPLRFWMLVWVVFFFVTVVTDDLIYVFFILLSLYTSTYLSIDSGGRSDRISGFPGISLVFILLLFFILPSLIGRLGILSGSGPKRLSPRFVSAMLLYCSLGLDFVRGGMSRSTSSGNLLISLPHIKTRF